MNKHLAIELLGGTPKKAAALMGYKSVQAIYLWPDILSDAVADRVRGVLSRNKKTRQLAAGAASL
jgi:hypothetical protein